MQDSTKIDALSETPDLTKGMIGLLLVSPIMTMCVPNVRKPN